MKTLKSVLRQKPLVVKFLLFLWRMFRVFPDTLGYLNSLLSFRKRISGSPRFPWRWTSLYPVLDQATSDTAFDRHYTFHPAWAARILAKLRPDTHYDISSAIFFSTLVSAFIPVRFYDFRPAALHLSDLFCGQADLLNLAFQSNSIGSLSCMHVVEHVGLGRYGDPLDPDGDLKAIAELKRVVRPGGHLLFVVPIGGQAQILFNAHRIYTADMIRHYFEDHFDLKEFALIPENAADGDLVIHPDPGLLSQQYYGCGCFYFVKRRREDHS
jgi:SAM-dependent methyltransferase